MRVVYSAEGYSFGLHDSRRMARENRKHEGTMPHVIPRRLEDTNRIIRRGPFDFAQGKLLRRPRPKGTTPRTGNYRLEGNLDSPAMCVGSR